MDTAGVVGSAPSSGAVAESPPETASAGPAPVVDGASVAALSAGSAETLRATVMAALGHSPDVRGAASDLALAGVNVDIARTGYQPTLEGSAALGAEGEEEMEVTVSQPLFDWGLTGARVREAHAGRQAAQAGLVAERENTALEAAQAFIAVKRGEALVAAARDNLSAYGRIARLARERARGGVGDDSEVQHAAIQQGEAEADLEDARSDLRDAQTTYLSRVGRMPRSLAEVPDLTPAVGSTTDIASAASRAPAVAAALAEEEAAKHAAMSERRSLLPKLSADAYVRHGELYEEPETGVVVRLRAPTVVGLRNLHQIRAAGYQAESARWVAESARRDVTLNVSTFQEQVPTLRNRLRLLKVQLGKARALRGLYEDQFEIGERSLLDLINVQGDIFRIERGLIDARYDIFELQYKAASALGVLEDAIGITGAGEGQ